MRCALHRIFDAGFPPNFFALPLALLEERVPFDVLELDLPLLFELRELLLLRLLLLDRLVPDLERDRDPLLEHEPLLLPLLLRLPFSAFARSLLLSSSFTRIGKTAFVSVLAIASSLPIVTRFLGIMSYYSM